MVIAGTDAVLGNGWLSKYVMGVDLENRQVSLLPIEAAAKPNSSNREDFHLPRNSIASINRSKYDYPAILFHDNQIKFFTERR